MGPAVRSGALVNLIPRGGTGLKITDVKTYLVAAYGPGGWAARNWCIVEVHADEGITGIGEASGWPRVMSTGHRGLEGGHRRRGSADRAHLAEDVHRADGPRHPPGVVGGGAMTGIEIALWDILGKSLNKPICDLLGGRIRDTVRVYAHASTVERAEERRDRGFDALKCSRLEQPVQLIKDVRQALGDGVDLMTDVHGPPWYSVPDTIRVGQELEEYDVLFYEDPVPTGEPGRPGEGVPGDQRAAGGRRAVRQPLGLP